MATPVHVSYGRHDVTKLIVFSQRAQRELRTAFYDVVTDRSCVVTYRGPWVVVNIAAFHAGARGLFPSLGDLKEPKCFFPIHS